MNMSGQGSFPGIRALLYSPKTQERKAKKGKILRFYYEHSKIAI